MKYYFITGVSSGIGEALVKTILSQEAEEVEIRGCARRAPDIEDERFVFYPCDLSSVEERTRLADVFFKDVSSDFSSCALINNAGTLGDIGFVGKHTLPHYESLVSLNVVAPMVLTEKFLHAFQGVDSEKIILNVSSGAARKDYAGWAAYCASKAALDRFTTVVALEQGVQQFPVGIHYLAPGVVDTPMQSQIRSSSEADFPAIRRFKELHSEGGLAEAMDVAKAICRLLKEPSLRQESLLTLPK